MALEEGESGPDSGEGEAGIPLRSPGLVRVKAQGLPTAVPSPVSCRGWGLASCLSFPAWPSLLLVLFPSPSLVADQLTVLGRPPLSWCSVVIGPAQGFMVLGQM